MKMIADDVAAIWGYLEEFVGITLKSLLITLVGPLSAQIGYLFLVVFLDLYLGIKVAKKQKTFNLKYAIQKTVEKTAIYLIWIIMFHSWDVVLNLPDSARTVCIVALLGQELLSAIRNTRKLGYIAVANAIGSVYEKFTRTNVDSNQGGKQNECEL
jgi:phage-related holin